MPETSRALRNIMRRSVFFSVILGWCCIFVVQINNIEFWSLCLCKIMINTKVMECLCGRLWYDLLIGSVVVTFFLNVKASLVNGLARGALFYHDLCCRRFNPNSDDSKCWLSHHQLSNLAFHKKISSKHVNQLYTLKLI